MVDILQSVAIIVLAVSVIVNSITIGRLRKQIDDLAEAAYRRYRTHK